MRPALAALLLALCGCADSTRLVAEYAPGRAFTVTESDWVPEAILLLPAKGPDLAQLDSGSILSVVAGPHEVVRYCERNAGHHEIDWQRRFPVICEWLLARMPW